VPEIGQLARGAAGGGVQQVLDHERLDVYDLALDFVVFANGAAYCGTPAHGHGHGHGQGGEDGA